MLDGKTRALMTGLGGAFCGVCTATKELCCGRPPLGGEMDVENVMKINRSGQQAVDIYEKLVQENGAVKRKPNDYDVRMGKQ